MRLGYRLGREERVGVEWERVRLDRTGPDRIRIKWRTDSLSMALSITPSRAGIAICEALEPASASVARISKQRSGRASPSKRIVVAPFSLDRPPVAILTDRVPLMADSCSAAPRRPTTRCRRARG